MKVAIANDHHRFFQKHQMIEFEDFLSDSQVKMFDEKADDVMLKRLHIGRDMLKWQSEFSLFGVGRDLWRDSLDLKKIIFQKQWAEIAAELTFQKSLRFAYEQLIVLKPTQMPQKIENKVFEQLISQPSSLQQISSFQGIECGLMIRLSGQGNDALPGSPSFFPQKPGNAVYFAPDFLFDFSALKSSAHRFLLVVYSQPATVYVLQERDPNTHFLKKLGYVFGDALKDKYHPIVYR